MDESPLPLQRFLVGEAIILGLRAAFRRQHIRYFAWALLLFGAPVVAKSLVIDPDAIGGAQLDPFDLVASGLTSLFAPLLVGLFLADRLGALSERSFGTREEAKGSFGSTWPKLLGHGLALAALAVLPVLLLSGMAEAPGQVPTPGSAQEEPDFAQAMSGLASSSGAFLGLVLAHLIWLAPAYMIADGDGLLRAWKRSFAFTARFFLGTIGARIGYALILGVPLFLAMAIVGISQAAAEGVGSATPAFTQGSELWFQLLMALYAAPLLVTEAAVLGWLTGWQRKQLRHERGETT